MKISSIHLNNMRNDAHFQFHTEFRDLVVQQNPLTLKVKPQFDSYLPLYNRVDDAQRINALAVVEGVAAYEPFIKTLNAVITKYAIKHHHHRHTEHSNHTQTEGTPNAV